VPPAPVLVPAAAPTPASAPEAVSPAPPAREAPVLETEIALLQRARRALATHDPVRALAALDRHRRRWPAGELLQEREVLSIQALILANDRDDARRRADRFLAHFPASTLAATVLQLRRALDQPGSE
jgi:outer membrane protein assembly factor BamD (BamD/ComL family)